MPENNLIDAAREFCQWESHFQIGNGINQVAAFADQISEQRVKRERERLLAEIDKKKTELSGYRVAKEALNDIKAFIEKGEHNG